MKPGWRNPRNTAQPLLSIRSERFKVAVPQVGNSAQRLPASKRAARARRIRARHAMCSAQRPAASKRVTQGTGRTSRSPCPCAQRLAASKRVAHSRLLIGLDILHVLNAFRHQRESRHSEDFEVPEGWSAQRLSASKRVALGASFSAWWWLKYCAQRLSASKRVAPFGRFRGARGLECSTPFGIKESRTVNLIRGRPFNGVLNAFRHQRGSHWSEITETMGGIRCSTPFGIKEGRTSPTRAT